MSTGTLALVILIAIIAQVAIVALIGIYRRRREYHEQAGEKRVDETLASTAQISEPSLVKKAGDARPAWEGFREFQVKQKVVEDGNKTICSFYLVPVDGRPLPAYKPGQYLTFKLLIKDQHSQEQKTVVRCYSLSDAPRPDYYRVTIKRVPAPVDQPNVLPGLSSNYFHDQIMEGSCLQVKAPSGHFHLIEDESLPVVLIGGGIGITPMLSILNTLLEQGSKREVWLFYGVRNGDEHIMKQHLETLVDTYENFHLHVCYSAPHENDVEGVDYQHRGRVDIPLLRTTLKLMRYQFYVCGPKPMMESMIPGLEDWGVDSGDIFYESFGPATLIRHEKAVGEAVSRQPITVTFSRSGKAIQWDPATGSLLEFAESNAIDVVSGCRAGSCGSCQTAVTTGEVDYNQQPDADVEPGHCLLCISIPKTDLTLDA